MNFWKYHSMGCEYCGEFKTLSRIPVTLVAGGMRHLNIPCMSIVSHKIYKYIYVNIGYYGIY